MKNKFGELELLDATSERMILDEAEKLDYVFERLEFGG
jgi:hypothetical protein